MSSQEGKERTRVECLWADNQRRHWRGGDLSVKLFRSALWEAARELLLGSDSAGQRKLRQEMDRVSGVGRQRILGYRCFSLGPVYPPRVPVQFLSPLMQVSDYSDAGFKMWKWDLWEGLILFPSGKKFRSHGNMLSPTTIQPVLQSKCISPPALSFGILSCLWPLLPL